MDTRKPISRRCETTRPAAPSPHADTTAEDERFRRHMDDALDRAKADARRAKRPVRRTGRYANADPLTAFLRKRVSRLNYAVKVEGRGKALPELTKDKLAKKYNSTAMSGRFGAALTNDQYSDHFAGTQTYFFWADHAAGTPEVLVNIDIDAGDGHGGGTPAGARRFANLIRDRLFPGMYYEPSTGGDGVHGYVVLRKEGVQCGAVRAALKNLEKYLSRLAEATGADIAGVEIKGLPPAVRYAGNGDIADITFGSWAKLPRGRGVMETAGVAFDDLLELDPDGIVVEVPAPTTAGAITERTKDRRSAGSYDSRLVNQEILDRLPELTKYAEKLLVQWTGASSFKAGRWAVTAQDVAQFFAVMLAIKPDPQDALPVRRIGGLWRSVVGAGDFDRPWNHHRFKAIRDLLSRHGHIDWIDFRYQHGDEDRGRQGRACRWRLSDLMEYTLKSFSKGEATTVDTDLSLQNGPHEHRVPIWVHFATEREFRWNEWAELRVMHLLAA